MSQAQNDEIGSNSFKFLSKFYLGTIINNLDVFDILDGHLKKFIGLIT